MLFRVALFLVIGSLAAAPRPALAQMFFSAKPDAPFAVGPLTVRATVTPALGPVDVSVLWSLDMPSGKSRGGIEQDLFLLWPGEISSPIDKKPNDKTLEQYVEQRGFAATGGGRLPLYALNLYAQGADAAPKLVGELPFVTFVQDSHALGLSPPASWIRIPWMPQMADRVFMMELRMRVAGIIKPKRVGWIESVFAGDRHELQLSFHEVRDRPVFPMYAEHRDRALRLADAPAELVAHFAQSDSLRIAEIYPPTSIRRLSETLETTEVVSLFLGATEGTVPQHLEVQFGYYSRLQGLLLVAIPLLLLGRRPRSRSHTRPRRLEGDRRPHRAHPVDAAGRGAITPRGCPAGPGGARTHQAGRYDRRRSPRPLWPGGRGAAAPGRSGSSDARVPRMARGAHDPPSHRLALDRTRLEYRFPRSAHRGGAGRGQERAGSCTAEPIRPPGAARMNAHERQGRPQT